MYIPLMLTMMCAAAQPTFPEHAVALGETRAHLEQGYNRLLSPPLNNPEFTLSDVHFAFTRRFTEYSGDVSGRMVGALHAAAKALDRRATMLDTLLKQLPALQKPDGHFGADQDLDASINQERDMPILWGNSRMLLGLAEIARDTKDPVVLEMARKVGDYIVKCRKYYGHKENFEKVGGVFASGFTTCYPAFVDGLAALAEVTGDAKYLDEARFIAELSLLDQEFDKHHSHGRLTAYRGMLDINALAPAPDLVEAAVAGWRKIRDEYELPTGGVQELLDEKYDRDEGCSEGDWFRVSVLLWKTTGDPAYLDAADHLLRNHLMATQFYNGGFGHHQLRVLHAGDNTYLGAGFGNVGSEAYWCCSMHGTQAFADAVRYGFAMQDGALHVTWLAEGRASFANGPTITAEHKDGNAARWTVTVTDATAPVRLKLRVPAWANEVSVDGTPMQAANGWVDVQAENGHAYDVAFPDAVRPAGIGGRYAKIQGETAPVRVFSGPDLYVLPDSLLDPALLPKDAVPVIYTCTPKPENARIPVLVEGPDGRRQAAYLLPISQRPTGACRALFMLRQVDAEAYAKLGERCLPTAQPMEPAGLQFAASGRYVVYLNGRKVFEGGGWHESPYVEVFAAPGKNTVAVINAAADPGPGLLGLIYFKGRRIPTTAATWTATPRENGDAPETLEIPETPPQEKPDLEELGGFGTAPWNHFPAHFAGTEAQWIWPQEAPEGSTWLFHTTFEN